METSNQVKASVAQTETEAEQDWNAHKARTKILGFDLGVKPTKFVFRALQTLKLYSKA